MKRTLKFTVIALTILLSMSPTFACTGVIVGEDLTNTEGYIFGRTEDLEVNHNKAYRMNEAGKYKEGESIVDVSYDSTFGLEYTFPHDSYHYTSISDTTPEYGIYDEAGFNEKGLIADMTVSARANDKVLSIDPYLDEGSAEKRVGLTEAIMPTIVLSSADSARHAVELVANLVATKGSAEGNIFIVADKNELWYTEIYTGHQFVSFKYPSDKFSVFPNTFWLNEVTLEKGEETENYNISADGNFIYSKDIFKVAKEAKTFVGDEENNKINLSASYAPKELRDSNRSRACSGILHLNDQAGVNMESTSYDFLQTTTKKIDLNDVIQFTRNRMENVNLEADDLGKGIQYPIGNRNTMEAHIFTMNKNGSDENPATMWLAIGSPLISPFVPYYATQKEALAEATNESNKYVDNSFYWLTTDTLLMAEMDRKNAVPAINESLDKIQKEIIEKTEKSSIGIYDPTSVNNEMAGIALNYLKDIQKEVSTIYTDFLKNNSYTKEYYGRRDVAVYNGSKYTIDADTANTSLTLHFALDKETNTLNGSFIDRFYNPVKEIKNPITIVMPKEAFKTMPSVNDGKEVTVEIIDNNYTFAVSNPEFKISLEKKEEATSEEKEEATSEDKEEPKSEEKEEPKDEEQSSKKYIAIIAVSLAVILAVVYFIRNKSNK